MIIARTWIIAAIAAVTFVSLAHAGDDLNPKNRQELKRADVPGTNTEVIISVVETQPGELERIPLIWKRSLHVGSNCHILAD